jgi:hypothetical protein
MSKFMFDADQLAAVLSGAAVILTAVIPIFWLRHARNAKRFEAVVDAYADREIDREKSRNVRERIPAAAHHER